MEMDTFSCQPSSVVLSVTNLDTVIVSTPTQPQVQGRRPVPTNKMSWIHCAISIVFVVVFVLLMFMAILSIAFGISGLIQLMVNVINSEYIFIKKKPLIWKMMVTYWSHTHRPLICIQLEFTDHKSVTIIFIHFRFCVCIKPDEALK